jgi:hypothetical protein
VLARFLPRVAATPEYLDFEASAGWTCAPGATQHHDNGFDYRIEHWSRFQSLACCSLL